MNVRTESTEQHPVATTRSAWKTLEPAWRWVFQLYTGYQVVFILLAAWLSSLFPKFPGEASISIWPISVPLHTWLERVILLPLVRYDVLWYLSIAEYGYGAKAGDTAFHPLFPTFMGLLGRLLGGNYLLAGWLIAQVCCLAMLFLLYRLVRLDHDDGVARRTTLFLLGSPLGFAFLLPYTESLLLLCIIGAIYAGRQGRWWLAGLAGAGAALTKQPGVVVLLPLLWELWLQHKEPFRARAWPQLIRPLLGLALTPLGLLIWLVYRATRGDVAFTWSDPSSLIGALLVTPSYKDVWGEYFSWPWVNFQFALEQLQSRPYFYLFINTFVMLIMLVLTIYAILHQRRSYALYSLVLVFMNLSIVYPLWPYMGIIRRFTIIFPMFIELAQAARSRALFIIILVGNTLLWLYIAAAYVRNAFVP